MGDHCDVSVVVSTYNRAAMLEQMLPSLLGQHADGLAYEVIVIDNNSTDDTPEVLRAWADRHPGVFRHCREPRAGVSNGSNDS